MAPRLKSNKWKGGWLTFTSPCIHFSTMSAGDAITDLCILVWICSEGVGMRPEFERVFWGGGFHALYISLGTSDTPRPPKQMLLLLSREMRSYRHYDHNHCALTYYKITLITIWWDSRFFWSLLESSTVSAMAPEMRHADSERVSGNEKRLKCWAWIMQNRRVLNSDSMHLWKAKSYKNVHFQLINKAIPSLVLNTLLYSFRNVR